MDVSPIEIFVQKSSDYTLFRFDRANRDVNLASKRKGTYDLYGSMKTRGFLPQYPLLVVKNGHGYIIKSGHHRFMIAQELGIPVYFMVVEEKSMLSLAEAEESTKAWKLPDYIAARVKEGNTEYIDACKFAQRYSLSNNLAFAWLWGEADTSNQAPRLRRGEFQIREFDAATRVASCYAQAVAQFPVLRGDAFAKAIWAASKLSYFSAADFLAKLDTHGGDLVKVRFQTRDAALQLVDAVWNKHRAVAEKKALAFDAKAILAARQKAFGKLG